MKLGKYFWSYNENALAEIKRAINDPEHPRFAKYAFAVLSRTTDTREAFSHIGKNTFIQGWPVVRKYWMRVSQANDFRAWWETVYEKLIGRTAPSGKGRNSAVFVTIGNTIRVARAEKGWTQHDLAHRTGLKQADISSIERGKKNMTLSTLLRVAEALSLEAITVKLS